MIKTTTFTLPVLIFGTPEESKTVTATFTVEYKQQLWDVDQIDVWLEEDLGFIPTCPATDLEFVIKESKRMIDRTYNFGNISYKANGLRVVYKRKIAA